LQGLGAAAVMPIALTVVGDIYTPSERARIQGYISSTFGISSIIGPALGGFIVTYWTWPWVFYLNVPIGLASLALLYAFHREPPRAASRRLDWVGAALLITGTSALIVLLSAAGGGGHAPGVGLSAPVQIGLVVVTAATLLAFIAWERRVPGPLLPLELLRRPLLATANGGALLAGVLIMGLTSVVPTLVQGVLERSPTVAGFSLAAMSIGWPLASSVSGFIMLRSGYRRTAQLGGLFIIAGGLVLVSVGAGSEPLQVAAGSALTGVGLGLTTTTYLIALQSSVPYQERGLVTGVHAFARQLGQALGAAVLGGLLTQRLARYLAERGFDTATGLEAVNRLLDPQQAATLAPPLAEALRAGLAVAVRQTFLAVVLIAVAVFIISHFLPAHGPRDR
ncbi:MAG TPA: MFS transporter, partial [Bacillota bacterium]